ncbi:hypothetical protein NESM_000894900 [Novymonas esmeraldas]|uniref:Uncharacterized protein n=1 Tax=Novymonas esmeraldas TaxID=1808958 RepID=A0AAW0F210_9TRYP
MSNEDSPVPESLITLKELRSQLDELRSMKEALDPADYTRLHEVVMRRFCGPEPHAETVAKADGPMGGLMSWDLHQLSKESTARIHPWATRYVQGATEVERWETAFKQPDCWENLRVMALERARTNTLCPVEVCLVSQLVFSEDKEKAAFNVANLILTTPQGFAFLAHNVDMLRRMNPALRWHAAKIVLDYPGPIYPPLPHHDLNTAILRAGGQEGLVGGGAGSVGAFTSEELEGGTYFAPIRDAEGKVVASVDLSDLEAYLGATQASTHKDFHDLRATLRRAVDEAKRTSQPSNTGRGRGRGKGKNRGRGFYGGAAEGGEEEPKN